MKTRRFAGPSSRVVLHQVRQVLGEDAVILSNRAAGEGVEIIAAAQSALAEITGIDEPLPAPRRAAPAALPPAHGLPAVESAGEDLISEIREVKGLLRNQMETLAWSESMRRRPLRALLLSELLAAGFTPALSRTIVERLPDDYATDRAREWLAAVLERNIDCAPADELIDRGGVYALVGPTGVGKTTTAAKLAGRCVMKHGARELGLITTDTYRVGAHDQLRAYGKILGVPALIAQDAVELRNAIESLAGKRIVLIDTTGMSQRDRRVAEQHELLASMEVNRLLVLNATAQAETLHEVVPAYRGAGALAGAIVSKLDEAARFGCVLDAAMRHRLRLQYLSTGQKVPEDLHAANGKVLVQRALRARPAEALLKADEIGLVFSALPGATLSVPVSAHA